MYFHYYSTVNYRRVVSWLRVSFISLLVFIFFTSCNSQEWRSKTSGNISEGYVTSKAQDYWRRSDHVERKPVGVGRFSPPAYVHVNNYNKNSPKLVSHQKSSSSFPKESFDQHSRREEALNSSPKYSYHDTHHSSKKPNYSAYNNNNSRRMRNLNNRRPSLPGHTGNENTRKINASWRNKDTRNSLNSHRGGYISKHKMERMRFPPLSVDPKFSNSRIASSSKKAKNRSFNVDKKEESFRFINNLNHHNSGLYRKHILDRSQFLPAFLPDELKFNNLDRKQTTKTEFNVPSIHKIPQPSPLKSKRPNIVLIMTDDLDMELGSLNYMPRLLRLMGNEGALFSNAYTTTPMCCPSRSSMLTGMYIHNHQVYTNHQNCSSPLWQSTHERRTFASYLSNAGYRTGYYGKYLNRYNGSHVPDGWNEWAGLLMNSKYYNYTINKNNRLLKYGNRYPHDYYPHVITNDGIKFLKSSRGASDPFLLVLSYPAPHGPEDSAPEHAHKFFNASDHHTASYNYAPNPDKQWMLQFTDRMADIQLKFTDLLMTKRLQTLQTVDESIEKIVDAVREIGEEENTYLFFTSDHGYHLGQFGLAKGKSMPFEFDVKVPFLVRGPGIKPGVDLSQIALNIDLAPTFLDIAGLPRPPQMDGRSLLPILQSTFAPVDAKHLQWRDSFLIESSGRLREEEELEKKEQRTWEREKALSQTLLKATMETEQGYFGDKTSQSSVNLYTSKHERLEEVCRRIEFASPCKQAQKWHCVKYGDRWKIKKCRRRSMAIWQKHCICHFMQGFGTYRKLDAKERRKQRNFLRKYLTKDFHAFDPKFIKSFNNVNVPLHFGARNARQLPQASIRVHRNQRRRFKRSTLINETAPIDNVSLDWKTWNATDNPEDEDRTQTSLPYFYFEEGSETDSESGEEGDDDLPLGSPRNVPLSYHETDPSMHDFVEEEELRDLKDQIYDITDELQILKSVTGSSNISGDSNSTEVAESSQHGCQATDGEIDCQDEVYANISAWRDSKIAIEDHISRLQQQLHIMNNILHHLQDKKPNLKFDDIYGEEENFDEYEEGDEEADDFMDGETNSSLKEEIEEKEEELDEVVVKTLEEGDFSQVEEEKEETSDRVSLPESPPPQTELNLPQVGLEIPLIEDVNYAKKSRKPRPHSRVHGQSRAHNNYHDREYYFDDYSSEYESKVPQTRKLYYPVSLPDFQEEVSGNDSLQSRLCWCDRRAIKKMAVQEARERKRVERQKLKEKRQKRKHRKKNNKEKSVSCDYSTLNCYTHDNNHWRTPPLWTDGQFCFCINSANNTYWCLRTINDTHNFLYCEFITGLITYYDLHIDPYQLRNVAFTLSNEKVLELNEKLTNLRSCKGSDECDGWAKKDKISKDKKSDSEISKEKEDNETISKFDAIAVDETGKSKSSKRRKRIKKLEERQKRKRLRKERRKFKKNNKLNDVFGSIPENPFITESEIEQSVRIPRKSRHKKGNNKVNKKQRRKERKRQKRKRKKEKRRLAKMRRRRGPDNSPPNSKH